MPPEQDILDDGGTPTASPEPNNPAPTPPTEKTETPEETAYRVIGPALATIGAHLKSQNETIAQLAQRVDNIPPVTAPEPTYDIDGQPVNQAFLDFQKDPDGRLASVMSEVLDKRDDGSGSAVANEILNTHIERHRQDIDSKYGPGIFDEHVTPVLAPALEALRQRPTQAVDRNQVKTLVDSALGQETIRYKLYEAYQTHQAKLASDPPPALAVGGVAPPRAESLSGVEKDFCDEANMDQSVYQAMRSKSPRTASEFKAVMSAFGKDKK